MNPTELRAELKKFESEVGPKADTSLSIHDYGEPVYASLYPFGITNNKGYIAVTADGWESAIEKLKAEWAKYSAEHQRQTIRDMALAIIRLTTEIGEATDAALRSEFDPGTVERYGDEACAMANTMAGRGPFTIKRMRGANAA